MTEHQEVFVLAIMPNVDDYLVGIDIGSSKVRCVDRRIRDPEAGSLGRWSVRELAPNRGTRRGNIVNVEANGRSPEGRRSEEAEVMAGVEISTALMSAWPAADHSQRQFPRPWCRSLVKRP